MRNSSSHGGENLSVEHCTGVEVGVRVAGTSSDNRASEEVESSLGGCYSCGCGLTVHPADLLIHSLYCFSFQPTLRPIPRITDPLVFIASGLEPPRSLSLRTRRRKKKNFTALAALESQLLSTEMSELGGILSYGEVGEGAMIEGQEDRDSHESLSTPPPAVMSFQIDETKPIISQLDNSKPGSEDDDTSQQTNGIMSPTDDNSKNGADEGKDVDSVLDELLTAGRHYDIRGGDSSLGQQHGGLGQQQVGSSGSNVDSPPPPLSPSHHHSEDSSTQHKEDVDKEKDGSGSELNSLIDEMLDNKEEKHEQQLAGAGASEHALIAPPPPASPQAAVAPPGGGIRMRPMLDLLGTNGIKEEKVEEPFAALNVLVNNLQSQQQQQQQQQHQHQHQQHQQQQQHHPVAPSSSPLSSHHHHHHKSDGFQPLTSITSHPPNFGSVMSSSGLQVSIQKRPAPQSFPPGITMTKQPRRDSESSSSSSHSPTPPSPKLPEGITLVKPGQKSSSDPVASMLATRGVSVMPSTPRSDNQAVSITKTTPKATSILPSNSALTITATPPKRSRPSSMALTTVDLTDDTVVPAAMRRPGPPPPPSNLLRPRAPPTLTRGRPPASTCDVCDKVFANSEALRIHMQTHATGRRGVTPMSGPRPPGGGPPIRQPMPPSSASSPFPMKSGVFECEVCTARYQTQQQLMQHTQRFHPDRFGGAVGHHFGLPVVDLDDSRTPGMLASLGIRYCIPMADLQQSNGGPGHYAIPVIAMDGSINPAVCNLDHMNCSNLLPLGPMKAVRRQ